MTDEFGGVAVEEAPSATDEFGGVPVASGRLDEFGGVPVETPAPSPINPEWLVGGAQRIPQFYGDGEAEGKAPPITTEQIAAPGAPTPDLAAAGARADAALPVFGEDVRTIAMLPFDAAMVPGKIAYAAAADLQAAQDQWQYEHPNKFREWVNGPDVMPDYGGNLKSLFKFEDRSPAEKSIAGAAQYAPGLAVAAHLGKAAPELASMMLVNPEGAAGRLLALGFSVDMIAHAKPVFEAYAEEINKPPGEQDAGRKAELLAGIIQTGLMAPMAGGHGFREVGKGKAWNPDIKPGQMIRDAFGGVRVEPKTKPPAAPYQRQPMDWGDAARPTDAPPVINPQASDPAPSQRIPFAPVALPQSPNPNAPIGDQNTLAVLRALGNAQDIPAELVTPGLQSVIEPAGYKLVDGVWKHQQIGGGTRAASAEPVAARPVPPPVPESVATLNAQVQLVQHGTKPAMLVTPGAPMPEVPKGLAVLDAEGQGKIIFNPKTVSPDAVAAAAASDQLGPLLGYGSDTKPADGGAVLQTRNADGTPVLEELVSPTTLPSAISAAQRTVPDGTMELVPPEQVIAERRDAPSTAQFDPGQVPVVEVPLKKITLSQDVPNFKTDADPETGIVRGQALAGKYERRGTAPVVLWERTTGKLEIITGRHRRELAQRMGEQTIPAQIVREAEGFTKDMALTFDAEANIRDGQGAIEDYAHYFRNSPQLTAQEAGSRGLLSRVKGKDGWSLGRAASDDLYALWADDKINTERAVAIARTAPGDAGLQALGVKQALKGKSPADIENFIRVVQAQAGAGSADQMDMFGRDDSAIRQAEEMASRASSFQNEIADQIRAVQSAAKRPEAARKLGVNIEDPTSVLRKVMELKGELARWSNWPQQPDLVAKVRGEVPPETSNVEPSRRVESVAPGTIIEPPPGGIRYQRTATGKWYRLGLGDLRTGKPVEEVQARQLEQFAQREAGNAALKTEMLDEAKRLKERPPIATSKAEISRLDKQINELLERKAGNDPLSLDEEHLLRSLEARRGQIDLLNVSAENTGQVRQLREKLVLVEDQRVKTQARAWKSDVRERAEQLQREASQYQMEAERIREQIRQLEAGPKAPSQGGDFFASPELPGPSGELGTGPARPPRPPRPADNPNFSVIDQSPMEMPEAVQWIRALTGVWPKVRERLGNAAGLFRFTQGEGGKGRVEMKAATFDLLTANEKAALREEAIAYATREAGPHDNVANIAKERYDYLLAKAYEEAKTKNPVAALKTIWHEIGHVVDWLPDHVIRGRGNVLGRIASLHKFLKGVLPLDPAKPMGERITPADKAKLTRDAEAQLREEMGPIQEIVRKIIVEEPEFRIIGITPQDITNILRESAGKETPELTRWFAEQDSKVKADVLRKAMKGLVDERLAALGKREQTGTRRTEKTVREKVGREPSTAEIKARFAELLKAEIKARNLAQLSTIKAELGPLIAWWRGTETIPGYFKTAHEMYADAFSVFANNPAAVRERAPTYYEMIHNYMDRKPDVMRLYDQTQQDIRTGLVMPVRVANLLTMWSNDDARSLTNMKSRWQTNGRDFYDNVVYHFDRRFGPVYRTAKGTSREGAVKEAVGNYLYRATEHERFLAALNQQVGEPLVKSNLDWAHDLGEYLFHKRVIEERFNIANPLGWTSKNSGERLAEMRQLLGPDRWAALEAGALKWHELYNQFVRDPVIASKMFTPELNQILLDRAHYATFAAVKDAPDTGIERIIEGQFGGSVTPHIYRQIGNLGEIKNPATATVLKGLSLISAAYRNDMKHETVKMLQELDPQNIGDARTRWTGKRHEPVIVDGTKVGTIVYMQDGKPQAFYVRKVVADAVNQGNPTENVIMNAMVKVTGWQKGLFTQLNYAFWPVNMVRDTAGFLMQMPGFTPAKYLKNLPTAIKAARDSVTHARPNLIADAALKRKLLISQADPRGVYSAADNQYELSLLSHGMNPAAWNAEAGRVHPIVKAWNYYRELGQTIERVNKISGMLYLDQKYPNLPEWKKREIIRERSGSPNFLERGASNPAVDLVWLFYNPWKEGMRSLAHSARENPYSFAAKATVAIALPTILQAAAVNGLLGDERKKQYRSIPDRDLANYLNIPLGWADEDHTKVVYLRLPLWEPARIAHGLLFQSLTERGQGGMEFAGGTVPGLNPIWTTGLQWAEYLQGKNPVDITRGVNVLTKTQQDARGEGDILNAEALAQMGKNTWNNLGGSILMRFKNLNLEAPAETVPEKFMGLPVVNNALGRWLKVSDRGIADADRKLTGPVEQQRAITREAMQPVIDKIVKGEDGALTEGEKALLMDPYALQYLRERLPEVWRARMSPELRRLDNAPSKASKSAIMEQLSK